MIKWNEKQYHCPVEVSMNLLSGKWKCLMLWHLNDGTKRYNELERVVPGVSQKMLTQQLKELEKDGLISRSVLTWSRCADYSLAAYLNPNTKKLIVIWLIPKINVSLICSESLQK